MIITRIMGGLGNQMFQYAYGRDVANKIGVDLRLDISFYNYPSIPRRKFSLNLFPNIEINTNLNIHPNEKIFHVTEKLELKKDLFSPDRSYYLDGYWQSEEFFKSSHDLIKKSYGPSEEFLGRVDSDPYLKNILSSNTVSMHIRRTDYLTSDGFHPVQKIEYYHDALESIGDYDNLLIFSDDINWCRDNLNFKRLNYIEGYSDLEQLWIMSLTKNNVIANSSYSWWGAWLNSNPSKIVIAPSLWFGGNSNLSDEMIIPKNWLRL